MAIAPGTRLGMYEVVALIGKGGMGEVYRAHDTRLNRDVALKVLPEVFARDSQRMARFDREAKVLASLNHTNIAAIYGFEESGPIRALVMELVEGPTLAERIAAGPVPVDEALPIARQVADAVEYAHDKNVIHRDLKPANIKVTADGTVKVLDFGLAKALSDEVAAEDMSNSPTLSMAATRQGVILGTAAYMSPEQAKGKTVDRRADVWAFGAVLYEMLTGKQAFGGDDVTEVLASVVKSEPALETLPSKTPSAIRTLVRRCLEKTLRRRLSHIGEARMILEDVLSGAVIDAPAAARRKGVFGDVRLAWSFAAAFLVAALVLGIVYLRPHANETPVLQVSVLPPEKASFDARSVPAVAPDGRRVAFVAVMDGKDSLWVRDLDSLTPRPLPGTEGALEPFWSPDSRFLGFFANGKLKKIDVAGGPALSLCDTSGGQPGYGGSWSKNDVIVFSPNNAAALFRVPAGGGASTPATTLEPGGVTHRFPWFLPDGHRFLYLDRNNDPEKSAIYMGDLDSQTKRQVVGVVSNVVYTPGRLLFVRGGVLMSQPFDIDKGQTNGDPVPIAEQVGSTSGGVIGQGLFSASQNGVVAYVSGSSGGTQPTRFDRAGKVVSVLSVPGTAIWNTVSPDGNTIAEDHADAQTGIYDLWLHDLKRGTASRFTFNSKTNRYPIWSPDGSHIAFGSNEGNYNLYQKATSGTGQDEALDKDARMKRPDDWSRDGRYIIEEIWGDPKTGYDIWILPLAGDPSAGSLRGSGQAGQVRKAFPYLQTRFNEHHAKLSPDGHWLAYVSDETNRDEVYVQSFPTPGGKWQVSTNGGGYPVWSRDGKELFFIGADQKLISVQVKSNVVNGSAQFEAGVPQPLFDTRLQISSNTSFDVSKDGQFVIPTLPEQGSNVPMAVVINWTAGLKK